MKEGPGRGKGARGDSRIFESYVSIPSTLTVKQKPVDLSQF